MDGGGRKLQSLTAKRDQTAQRDGHDRFAPAWLPRRAGTVGALGFLVFWGFYGLAVGGHLGLVTDQLTVATGFGIHQVRITGQREVDEIDVLAALAIDPQTSLVTFDADDARARIADNPWVDDISVLKLFPDTLQVSITERNPFALWQRGRVVSVIDRGGKVIDDGVAPRFANLPMIVGHGGQRRAAEFIDMLGRYPTLKPRVQASVYVAERRWNLVLENGIEIRLPEKNISSALRELVRLDNENAILSRDITTVDLRLDDRIVVRLSDEAVERREIELKRRDGFNANGADT